MKAVDLGENHGCVILSDGGGVCWGLGANGRLGTGNTNNVENLNAATRVTALNGTVGNRAISLSTAFNHSCAVRSDGRVFCWGLNLQGQCGVSPTVSTEVLTPADVGITDAVAVTTGDNHSCALKSDGSVVCWGANSGGELGNGTTTSSHVPSSVTKMTGTPGMIVALGEIVAVEAQWSATCALSSTGDVSCWGQVNQGTSTLSTTTAQGIGGFSNITAIVGGGNHLCGRRADGTVQCMGDNAFGQLGQGNQTPVAGVVTIAGAGNEFASIFGGNFHVCGVRADGSTRCWGDNGSGQLGVGNTNPVLSPTAVPTLSQVVGGGGGMAQTCWLRANTESLACAGANNHGQLGNGDPTHASQSTPVNVQLGELVFQGVAPFGYFQQVETAFTAGGVVDAGQCHVCAIRNTFSLASFSTQREVVCWGRNGQGQLGNGVTGVDSPSPVTVGGISEPVVALSAGGDHSCALTSGGRVWCWGANAFGQLGNGVSGVDVRSSTPQIVSALTEVVQITTGQSHTCAVLVNGHAWCWGRGADGQLGRGTSTDSNVPVEVLISANTPMTDITSLSAGWGHTCARRVNGEVRCWGEGSFSRNGHPTGKDLLLAGDPLTFPSGFRPVRLSAGEMHTCALSDNGSVACWGGNAGNRLALGAPFNTQGEIESPQSVPGLTGVVGLQGSGSTLCAVKSDGTAQCWGVNASGTVGNGFSGATVTMPTTVTGLSEVVSVTSDCNVSCAMLANGSVRCWGSDSNGSLGNGSPDAMSTTPVSVLGF